MMKYAAVEITFIDRSTGFETVHCYPVTRVVLRERDNPERGRVFLPNEDGQWIEAAFSVTAHTVESVARENPEQRS